MLRLHGTSMVQAVGAITALLPLADDVDHPVSYMQVSGTDGDYRAEVQREVMGNHTPQLFPIQSAQAVDRFAFYERTWVAYAIVLIGEQQPFGNFILRKGVIGENLRP